MADHRPPPSPPGLLGRGREHPGSPDDASPGSVDPSGDQRSDPSVGSGASAKLAGGPAAFGALAAYGVVAFFVVLFWVWNWRWFRRDEWIALTAPDVGHLGSLFEPHNEHWTTIPTLVLKAMYAVVCVHSYRPYQALVVLAHLGVCTLLWIVMRRAGVRPWMATCVTATLVLFGPGEENLSWAFQITFTGSVLFGLGHLLLADHDGGIDRRDWIGLALGAAGLMCSGVGPVMVLAVGVATLLRRGWKQALFHTVPLGVMFGTWWLIEDPVRNSVDPPGVATMLDWVRAGESGIFSGLGHFTVVGMLLGILLVVGLVLAWLPLSRAELRVRSAMPLGLLVAVPIFFAGTSRTRWPLGAGFSTTSRYLYIGVALTLPALAVAADAIARRWRALTPLVVVLILLGVPWNIRSDDVDRALAGADFTRAQEKTILGAAYLPGADSVADWVEPDPDPYGQARLTMGWLRAAKAEGKLPPAPHLDDDDVARLKLRLGLAATKDPLLPEVECQTAPRVELRPQVGDRIGIVGPVNVSIVTGDDARSPRVRYDPKALGGPQADRALLEVGMPDLDLRFEPVSGRQTVVVCR
jgi:hypothetical protein